MAKIYPSVRRVVEQAPAGDRDVDFADGLGFGDTPTLEAHREDSIDLSDALRRILQMDGESLDLADAQRAVTLEASDDDPYVTNDQGFVRLLTVHPTADWYANADAPGTSHGTGDILVSSDTDISGASNERRGYVQFDLRQVIIPSFRDRGPDVGTNITIRASNSGLAAQTINWRVLGNSTTPFAETATWTSMGQPDDTPGSYLDLWGDGSISVPAGASNQLFTLSWASASSIFDNGETLLLALTHPGGLLGTLVTFLSRAAGGNGPILNIQL